jgi:glyoxylase-like metal-dependent hydrolase (beta-lactamase superfamily II)
VEELRPGLWTWTAPHPDWTPEQGGPEGWERDVRSYALAAGGAFILFDPMSPPPLVDQLAAGKDVAVLLTCQWHQRGAVEVVERLGASVYAPEGDTEKVNAPATAYRLGETLPGDVEPRNGAYPSEYLLWIPARRALVAGDALLDGEGGLRVQPDSWLDDGMTHEGLRARLRPLLDLPFELVLPTHGNPVVENARGELERALAT